MRSANKLKIRLPNISVVMPVYNGARYLGEAIESVLNQTHELFELLLIDDFSTDETVEIIKNYQIKDDRILLFTNEFKKGIVGSLNTGLKHASEIYIARADADDINVLTRFEEQINFMKAHPNVDIVGGGYHSFNESGLKKKHFHPNSSMELAWRFVSDSFFCHPATMFKKDIALECGGYDNMEAEDFDLFSKILKKHKGSNLNKILLNYREHQESRSRACADAITESVKQIFLKNYSYYINNQDDAEVFFQFQSNKCLSLKDFNKVAYLNSVIVRKIANDYHQSVFSFESIWLIYTIIILQFKAVFKNPFISFKKFLKPYYRFIFPN